MAVYRRLLDLVISQFVERKLRSSLTVIGIMIGICALVSLILLSNGLKEGVTSFTASFGTDSILLAPRAALGGNGGPSGYGLITSDDVAVIDSLSFVRKVNYYLGVSRNVEFGREKFRLSITGYKIDSEYKTFISQDIAQGRYLTDSDSQSVNIGYKIANNFFEKPIAVNSFIKIDGTRYRVVGIFAEEGDQGADNAIYTDIESLRKLVGDQKAVSALDIRINPGTDIDLADKLITEKLKRYRGQKDFSTITPAQLRDQINQLLGVVDIVVISIAAISLLVGVLGIMNSLYTSVLQRTKEIGTMKAVGATNFQILFMFVLESSILGFAGGLLGVISGYILAFLFVIPINLFGIFKFVLLPNWPLFGFAIILSVLLGVVAGFLPALRAARLKPVDALRYE